MTQKNKKNAAKNEVSQEGVQTDRNGTVEAPADAVSKALRPLPLKRRPPPISPVRRPERPSRDPKPRKLRQNLGQKAGSYGKRSGLHDENSDQRFRNRVGECRAARRPRSVPQLPRPQGT